MDEFGLAERLSKVHMAEFMGRDNVDQLVENAERVAGQIVGFEIVGNRLKKRAGMVLANAALRAGSDVYRTSPNVGLTQSEYQNMAEAYISGFGEGVLADKSQRPLSLMTGEVWRNDDMLEAVAKDVRAVIPFGAKEKMGSTLSLQITSESFWTEGYLAGVLVDNMRPGIERIGVGAVIGRFSRDSKFNIKAERTIETAEKMGRALGIFNNDVISHARQALNGFKGNITNFPRTTSGLGSDQRIDLW